MVNIEYTFITTSWIWLKILALQIYFYIQIMLLIIVKINPNQQKNILYSIRRKIKKKKGWPILEERWVMEVDKKKEEWGSLHLHIVQWKKIKIPHNYLPCDEKIIRNSCRSTL